MTTTLPPAHGHRVDNLDLLRAAAISLVLVFHLVSFVPWPQGIALRLAQGLWSGVDLFFVLSGYLIGGLFWSELEAEGTVMVGRFMMRRLLRTVPPYLVALHLIYLGRWRGGQPIGYDWTYLVFLQNYFGMPMFSVSWSLCIEEHFYLVAPLLLMILARSGRPAWILALFPIPLLSRLLIDDRGADPFGPFYFETHNHFEGLVLGVWLSWARYARPQAWGRIAIRAKPLAPVVALLVLAYGLWTPGRSFDDTYAYTVLALAFGFLLFILSAMRPIRIARSPVTKWMARAAFSLYLTHTYVMFMFGQRLLPKLSGLPVAIQSVLALGVTLAAGLVFYLLVERPVLALRDRTVAKSREANAALAPSA